MADFPVKWFSSDMGGSPENGDQYGALIELLKACLVTGFNTKPIASLTYDSTTQQATASVGSGHGYLKWQVIAISGADQAGYNGEYRVTAIGSDWVRFALDTAPAATEATGELIEIKAAPVGGWEVAAEDAETYRIAFQRADSRATDLTLVVKNGDRAQYTNNPNSYTRFAVASWVSGFVDLDTYESATGRFWPCSGLELNVAHDWVIVADPLMFYYMNRYGDAGQRGFIPSGDILSVRPGDAYHCLNSGISSSEGWQSSSYHAYPRLLNYGDDFATSLSRGHTQLPGDVDASLIGTGERMGNVIGYPNKSDNGFYISLNRIIVREGSEGETAEARAGQSIRGYLPGVLEPLHSSSVYDMAVMDNLPMLEGVPVLTCMVATKSDDAEGGLIAFRLDDWRQA